MKSSTTPRNNPNMAVALEDKFDEVRQLLVIGKEKGYLLYDEVNELLRSDITSSDELDDIFSMFGQMGIEVVDSDQKFREKAAEGEEGMELDLTPGTLDKTNDPVRMYLRGAPVARALQHCRPEQRVEIQDVLADEMVKFSRTVR